MLLLGVVILATPSETSKNKKIERKLLIYLGFPISRSHRQILCWNPSHFTNGNDASVRL